MVTRVVGDDGGGGVRDILLSEIADRVVTFLNYMRGVTVTHTQTDTGSAA